MVRHYNVPPDGNVISIESALAKRAEDIVDFGSRKNPRARRCVERHEIKRLAFREDSVQTQRAPIKTIFDGLWGHSGASTSIGAGLRRPSAVATTSASTCHINQM
jgi:hypothetical protein